jgi:hypothetical protein
LYWFQDGGNNLHWSAGKYLTVCMASYLRMLEPSSTPLWELQFRILLVYTKGGKAIC